MRHSLIILLIMALAGFCFFGSAAANPAEDCLKKGIGCLKARHDRDALDEFSKTLKLEPDNLSALCGKAEALRRSRRFAEAEEIIESVLSRSEHPSCLNNLAYIRYYQGKLDQASQIIAQVLKQRGLDNENKALAYLLLGTINAKKARESGLIGKFTYGLHIKQYFRKAKELAPDLPEVRLGLGTFYLLAPGIIGGNLDKARDELECAVEMTPDFATANARLAQVHKEEEDYRKFCFYFERAKKLDPDNEVIREIEEELDE